MYTTIIKPIHASIQEQNLHLKLCIIQSSSMNCHSHLNISNPSLKPTLVSNAHHCTKYMDQHRFKPDEKRTKEHKHIKYNKS